MDESDEENEKDLAAAAAEAAKSKLKNLYSIVSPKQEKVYTDIFQVYTQWSFKVDL